MRLRRLQKIQRRPMPDNHPLLPLPKVLPRPHHPPRPQQLRPLNTHPPPPLNLRGRKTRHVLKIPRQNGRPKVRRIMQLLKQPPFPAPRLKRVPKKRLPEPNPLVPPKLIPKTPVPPPPHSHQFPKSPTETKPRANKFGYRKKRPRLTGTKPHNKRQNRHLLNPPHKPQHQIPEPPFLPFKQPNVNHQPQRPPPLLPPQPLKRHRRRIPLRHIPLPPNQRHFPLRLPQRLPQRPPVPQPQKKRQHRPQLQQRLPLKLPPFHKPPLKQLTLRPRKRQRPIPLVHRRRQNPLNQPNPCLKREHR